MSDAPKPNLLQRMNAVMKEVTYVQKEKKQGMRYSIVSHDVVTAKLRPSLVNNGIVYWPIHFDIEQHGNRTQVRGTVRFANVDDPSDYIDVATAGFGIDDQDKGPGKAISYAVKYAQLKAFALETGDDPDEDQDVVLKPDPQSDDMRIIKNYETFIAHASTIEELSEVNASYKADMLRLVALAPYSALVQAAGVKARQKMAELKKAAASTDGSDPAAQ